MAKHHHQSKAEQIDNKAHGAPPSDDVSIQIRAYQIHLEKGGSDLDNWLEAERSFLSQELVTKA